MTKLVISVLSPSFTPLVGSEAHISGSYAQFTAKAGWSQWCFNTLQFSDPTWRHTPREALFHAMVVAWQHHTIIWINADVWSCENRFQWTFNQNKQILVKKMKLKLSCKLSVVLYRSQLIDQSMLTFCQTAGSGQQQSRALHYQPFARGIHTRPLGSPNKFKVMRSLLDVIMCQQQMFRKATLSLTSICGNGFWKGKYQQNCNMNYYKQNIYIHNLWWSAEFKLSYVALLHKGSWILPWICHSC